VLVRFGGKVLFMEGPCKDKVLNEVEKQFKAHCGWTLPKKLQLKLSGSPCLLSTEATFDEVN
jgi:hypothetical protein